MLSRRPAGEPFIAVPAFAVPDGGGTARRPRDRRRPGGRERGLQSRVLRRPPTPSKYWVRALSERAVFDLAELLGRAEDAAAVRKTLLLGLVDEESDLTYYSVREAHPRGHPPAPLRKTEVVVHFLGDRAVVIDEVQAKALHDAGFFFFFQAEDGIRDVAVTGVQTCALPICGVKAALPERDPRGNHQPDRAALDDSSGKAPREHRSEERRVGKECRSRWSPYH